MMLLDHLPPVILVLCNWKYAFSEINVGNNYQYELGLCTLDGIFILAIYIMYQEMTTRHHSLCSPSL